MPITDRKLRVFLCHASQDRPIVRELYQRLLTEGWIDPWLDEEKLLPGQDWDMEIEKAVEAADAVIVCLSNNSVTKEGYIQRELKFVLDVAQEKPEGTIFIIPIRLDECQVPRRIRSLQYLDLFHAAHSDASYRRLVESLNTRAINNLSSSVISDSNSGDSVFDNNIVPEFSKPAHKQEEFTPSGHRIYTLGDMEFVKVPAGKFLMGSDSGAWRDEIPQHEVLIAYDFWIGRYPITCAQYDRFAKATVRHYNLPPGKELHPIQTSEIHEYITWLNQSYGKMLPHNYTIRLPTEAEWEKAARGIDGRLYPWGNERPTKYHANFGMGFWETLMKGLVKDHTMPVNAHMPQGDSPYGASDMVGNLAEETQTLWGKRTGKYPDFWYPYNPKDGRENTNADWQVYRVARGGYYSSSKDIIQVTTRFKSLQSGHNAFRIVIATRIP